MSSNQSRQCVRAPAHINADFACICKGNSMVNARIWDGDVVFVREQEVNSGEIAAVQIGGEVMLYRVYIFPDRIVLESENPMYPPKVYWGKDMAQVTIIGKATNSLFVVQ